MEDLKEELKEVKEELGMIEQYLQELLERQNTLIEKKVELEVLIKDKAAAKTGQSLVKTQQQEQNFTATDFPWSEKLQHAKKTIFHLDKFRPLQEKAINATMSGRDCILIMPTGGGKSLCFQLPAVISDGVTLVISPLVSLMENQLMGLKDRDIDAALLNASSSKQEVKDVQDAMINKSAGLKLLYVTPEKVAKSKRFMAKVEKMFNMGRLARIAIDEVHCCSQWGHDFRPDYKILGILKRQFPGTPIIGLTATATTKVIDSVKNILNIQNCVLFQSSFNRPNLFYEVRPKLANHSAMMTELQQLIGGRFHLQSGIIYCFSKKDTEEVCRDLQSRGIKAGCYHGDMDARQRSYVHRKWLGDEIHVVVATIAFGMGIDKPNVRFVIHHSISKSMENYYQESGRAGRDEQPAYCIVYFRFQDMFRQSTMVFTEQTGLDNLYKMVSYCIECNKCLRTVIARHFGERWDSSQCNKMCDICRNKETVLVVRQDMSHVCQTVLQILKDASMKNQRMTGLKIMDSATSKLKKTSVTREDLEKVLAKMILEGYLREDFHFTPYSTISYLIPGAMAKVLSSPTSRMMMNIVQKTPKRITDTTSRPRPTSAQGSSDRSILKPKLSIVNPKKSKFTSNLMPLNEESEEDVTNKTKTGITVAKKTAESQKSTGTSRKRKSVDLTMDSSDDSADFDFGSEAQLKPCKVSRMTDNSDSNEKTTASASGKSAKKRRADDSSDDSDCVVQSSACDKPKCSPAKVQKLDNDSACVLLERKVRISKSAEKDSILENGFDTMDLPNFDDTDGRLKISCCVTIDDSENDEPDGLGEESFQPSNKNIDKVAKTNKKGAKKQKTSAVSKSKSGRRQVYVVTGDDLGGQTNEVSNERKDASAIASSFSVKSDLSSESGSLITKSSYSTSCSDGIHCGEDSDSDETTNETEKDSVKLGRYAVRYTKDSGNSPVRERSPVPAKQESVLASSVTSTESSLRSTASSLHSSIRSKQLSASSLHSSQISESSASGVSSEHHPVKSSKTGHLDTCSTASGSSSSRTWKESKRSRSPREVKVRSHEGSRSHRELTKAALDEALSQKGRRVKGKKRTGAKSEEVGEKTPPLEFGKSKSTGESSLGVSPGRERADFKKTKEVALEVPTESVGDGEPSVDSRARRRRPRVKKTEEGSKQEDISKKEEIYKDDISKKEEMSEASASLSSTGTSDSLDVSNSKAIVRGVFNRLRQSRGLSDEGSTLSSTSSRESTLTGRDVNFDFKEAVLSQHSLKASELVQKSKGGLSKSLKPSFKPYSYFEKPLGHGGARSKAEKTLPILKKSKEFEQETFQLPAPVEQKQAPKESFSKTYAFGDASDENVFKSWAFRQHSSSSSTTSDTTPSSVHISQESLHSVKSIESEEVKPESDEDMEETIQSPKAERKFVVEEKVEQSPRGDSTNSSINADTSTSSGPGDATVSSSMEMSDLYNIYAKQLNTLDIVDSSSENEGAGAGTGTSDVETCGAFGARPKKGKAKARMQRLMKTVEKCAILEEPDTDDSVGSAGSVEKSMFNLENLPVAPQTQRKTMRKEASDSEEELEELCDVYLDQLQHMKR